MNDPTSSEHRILAYIESGAVDAAVLSLAHYHGEDKSLYQKAYAATLRKGMVYHLCQLFRAKKNDIDFLPNRELLGELNGIVLAMYRQEMEQPLKSRQLTPDVMRSIFQMLVFGGLIGDFLALYISVNAIFPLTEIMKPDAESLFAAISFTQQNRLQAERAQITEHFGL